MLKGLTLGCLSAVAFTVGATNVDVVAEIDELTLECDASKPVRIYDRNTKLISIAPGESKDIVIAPMASEFTWYCGGDPKRAGAKNPFNLIQTERDESGTVEVSLGLNYSKL
jgi:hypothetical protein